jgi:hypothetical protein
MIALSEVRCKGRFRRVWARLMVSLRKTKGHGIVSGIILPPHFRPSPAPLTCEDIVLRWPGPFGSGFLSPQPPGAVGIGPVRRGVKSSTLGQRKLVLFAFGTLSPASFRALLKRANPEFRNYIAGQIRGEQASGFAPTRARDYSSSQRNDVIAAPSIGPGLSRLPSWTYTTAASTPSREMFSSGTVQLPELPFQSPTFNRLRTTL